MLSKTNIVAAIAATTITASAQAAVAFFPGLIAAGGDKDGAPISNGTFVVVIDADGDGFEGVPYTEQSADVINGNSWLWDQDDYILERGKIEDGTAFGSATVNISEVPGYDVGQDSYYFLWFDTPYSESADAPGAGVYYGAENLGKLGADGATLSPTVNGGAAGFKTIVPEPSAALLMLAGLSLTASRRKNK